MRENIDAWCKIDINNKVIILLWYLLFYWLIVLNLNMWNLSNNLLWRIYLSFFNKSRSNSRLELNLLFIFCWLFLLFNHLLVKFCMQITKFRLNFCNSNQIWTNVSLIEIGVMLYLLFFLLFGFDSFFYYDAIFIWLSDLVRKVFIFVRSRSHCVIWCRQINWNIIRSIKRLGEVIIDLLILLKVRRVNL
jgi:hypothetical protein